MGKATRDAYGEALKELGAVNPDIVVLDADLSASTKPQVFAKAYPDRFFDTGIAEGNMMGVAAGLAAAGKIPFASTFAVFGAGRAYEQIRNSICYPKLNNYIVENFHRLVENCCKACVKRRSHIQTIEPYLVGIYFFVPKCAFFYARMCIKL